jgi:hypothetical protein
MSTNLSTVGKFTLRRSTGAFTVSGAVKNPPLIRFKDFQGVDCIISEADTIEATILIGCEYADIRRLVLGEGMQPVYVAPPYTVNTQMNLDRQRAIEVVEVLQAFIEVTEPPPPFDDLGTTLIIAQPESTKPILAIAPSTCQSLTTELPETVVSEQSEEPPIVPALEQAKVINDINQIIDRLEINKLQKAFVHVLGTLSGICIGSWTPSEAIAKAAAKFDLSREEALRLRKMHGISDNCGTSMR